MKAIAFDLGDTLVEYEGMPLSWEAHYPEALGHLANFMGAKATPEAIACGCAVLRRYNTRIHPRAAETSFAFILGELRTCFGLPSTPAGEPGCAAAFFRIFRQQLRCFPDARPALARLREAGLKIGVFTDVPYGMPRELVLKDIGDAGIADAFDALLTSRDVGWRKPATETLQALARVLGCYPHEMVYVGNERKDVEVALAFGCRSVLLDRGRTKPDWGQHQTIVSLSDLSSATSAK